MDPDVARSKVIELANVALAMANDGEQTAQALERVLIELAEAVHDLDSWLRQGGFLPAEWTVKTGVPGISQTGRKQDVDVHVPHSIEDLR